MSKILFTDAQIKKLTKNKWIKNITNKGITYTNEFKYKLVKECENYKKFPQDVFRGGNCWDNAPQESYFGHMKDELNLDTCFTFRDVCNEIKDYIEYYNNYRYQWNLKKMTPVQYRNHLFASIV